MNVYGAHLQWHVEQSWAEVHFNLIHSFNAATGKKHFLNITLKP